MAMLQPPSLPHYPFTCRVLPHEIADGPTQMALDEALLDSVARGGDEVAIRTYEWSTPTLSLGYFQHFRDVVADPRWRNAPVIRRSTGGGALWHDREITYAVVVPRSHPLAHPSSALYRAVHEGIASHLRLEGWDAARRMDVARFAEPTEGREEPRPFLCFLDRDGQDVVVGSAKVVGSAQRRRAGAVLQHGSVLLEGSPTTPELPGLADLGGPSWASRGLDGGSLRALLAATLGESVVASDWMEAERCGAERLRREQYADRAWTERR